MDTSHAPILTPGCTVEIDYDFQTVIPSPGDGVEHVLDLTLDVRFTWTDVECPVAYRKSNMVKSDANANVSDCVHDMENNGRIHPAAAMAAKSASVIHVFQCSTSVSLAAV
jgi:hypothetical protein